MNIRPAVPLRWLSVLVTTHCPRACDYCVAGSRPLNPRGTFNLTVDRTLALAAEHDAIELTGGEPLLEPALGKFLDLRRARVNLLTAGSRDVRVLEHLRLLRPGDHVLITHHLERNNAKEVAAVLQSLPTEVDRTVKVLARIGKVECAVEQWKAMGVRTLPMLVDAQPRGVSLPWPSDYPDWLSIVVDGERMPPERAMIEGKACTRGARCEVGTYCVLGKERGPWCGARLSDGSCGADECLCTVDLLSGEKHG